MKDYVKPEIDIIHSDFVLMSGMSLHDEIGDGQLANDFIFEDEDSYTYSNVKVWGEDED